MLTSSPVISLTPSSSQSSAATYYDAVVAGSGGDYTTLGAAITAGKKRIFVRSGSYTESNIVLNGDEHIVGESRDAVILNLQSNSSLTLANNSIIESLGFTNWVNNGVRSNGSTDNAILNCRFEATTTGVAVRLGGCSRVRLSGCIFNNSTANSPTANWITDGSSTFFTGLIYQNFFQGLYQQVMSITQGSLFRFGQNYCQSTYSQNGTFNFVDVNQSTLTSLHDCSIENNYFGTDSAATATAGIRLNKVQHLSVRNNNLSVSSSAIAIKLTGSTNCLVSGNYVIRGNTGVSLDATSTNNQVITNDLIQAATPVSDSGSSNVIAYNGAPNV